MLGFQLIQLNGSWTNTRTNRSELTRPRDLFPVLCSLFFMRCGKFNLFFFQFCSVQFVCMSKSFMSNFLQNFHSLTFESIGFVPFDVFKGLPSNSWHNQKQSIKNHLCRHWRKQVQKYLYPQYPTQQGKSHCSRNCHKKARLRFADLTF